LEELSSIFQNTGLQNLKDTRLWIEAMSNTAPRPPLKIVNTIAINKLRYESNFLYSMFLIYQSLVRRQTFNISKRWYNWLSSCV